MIWQRVLLVAIAGALGTLARWGLASAMQRLAGGPFPWGTFAVNILGTFLFGVVWGMVEDRVLVSDHARIAILTGFMGAFTTFSTFMFESGNLAREGEWFLLGANLIGQNVAGIAALFAGLAVTRLL